MQTDYLDAHKRHWEDAERLFQANRLANADHLYGMAAECGLKRLMIIFGMQNNSGFTALPEDLAHANKIWARFETYRQKYGAASYALPSQNPFHNWNASQRYAPQSGFDQTRVQRHQAGARLVCSLIRRARMEGLI